MMRVLGSLYFLASAALVAADEMQTRVFPVNTELIGGRTFVRPNQPPSFSPMGYNEAREIFVATNPDDLSGPQAARQSAKAVLLNEGITFPPGATALFNPQTGLLAVHNTPENLKHTQLFLDAFDRDLPVNLSFAVTVIEAPGEMIRQVNVDASISPDGVSNLELLLRAARQPDSLIRVVGEAFIESRSGQRCSIESVNQYTLPSGMTSMAEKRTRVDLGSKAVGLKCAIDPFTEDEDIALSLTLDVNSRPPFQHQVAVSDPLSGRKISFPAAECWEANFKANVKCKSGHTRLIGITKPQGTGNEDVLWAAFLRVGRHLIPSTRSDAVLIEPAAGEKGAPSRFKKAVFKLPEGMLEHFMPVTPPETLQRWLEANGQESVPSASASYSEGELTVFNTQENVERLHGILRDMRRSLTSSMLVKFHTVEAPAPLLRDLLRHHANQGGHTALWNALQSMIERGEASTVNSAWIAGDPEVALRHESGRERSWLAEFAASESGAPEMDFGTRTLGSSVEVYGFTPALEDFVNVSLKHELETGPLVTRRQKLELLGSAQPVDFPLQRLHIATSSNWIALRPGATRLVTVNRPEGNEKTDILWATFVTCELQPRIPLHRDIPTSASSESADSEVVEMQVFQAPDGFFTGDWGPITPIMAEETLRQAGIDLPTDADVKVSSDSRILRVRSRRETLEAIGALFRKSQEVRSRDIAVTAHIIETSVELAREIEKAGQCQSDHSSLLQRLQSDTRVGRAKHVATMRIETRDDVQATVHQTRQIQQLVRIGPGDKGEVDFTMDDRKFGHLLEVRPKIALVGDLVALEFSIEVSPANDPIRRMEYVIDATGKRLEFPLTDILRSKLESTVTLRPGTNRLVWLCRPPESSGDTVHAIFLNCSFVP